MKPIAIDGGPMAGKTTVIEALRREFGSSLYILPEAATRLFESGVPLPDQLGSEFFQEFLGYFQPVVFNWQRIMEWTASIKAKKEGAKAIIVDRGIPDQAAYIPGGYPALEKMTDMTQEQMLSRYSMVIKLESLAVFAPERFGKAGNDSRYETEAGQAALLDARIAEAWQAHPKLVTVDGRPGIDYVIDQAVEIIRQVIEAEHEVKYLLQRTPPVALPDGVPIQQGYIFTDNGEQRVRQLGQRYFQTYKGEGTASRREYEHQIPPWVFDILWGRTEGRRLAKTRFYLPVSLADLGGFVLELDYCPDIDRWYLECEFDDLEQMASIGRAILPTWAQDAIDVTEDSSHKAKNLAA